MLSRLKTAGKAVGAKQTKKAVVEGRAECVFIAEDADPSVTGPIIRLCGERAIGCVSVPTGQELGRACGIEVAAACAALLGRI